MALLQRSGAYCTVLANWPPSVEQDGKGGRSRKGKKRRRSETWTKKIQRIAEAWRKGWPKLKPPSDVKKAWMAIVASWAIPVAELQKDIVLCSALLELCAICDSACADVGLPHSRSMDNPQFYLLADTNLSQNSEGSTLCVEIDGTRIRVLPKMRTPQTGLTVRSLSMHLALCPECELKPKWFTAPSLSPDRLGLNLLIVPWPLEIHPSQFCETQPLKSEMGNMPEDFGFFTFQEKEVPPRVLDIVQRAFASAVTELGRIDGIILPELALTKEDHEDLSAYVLKQGAFLIAGVGEPSNPPTEHGTNMVCLDIPGLEPLSQRKHHRWKLTGAQIEQYGLGGKLHPERDWWEHVGLENRQVMLVSMFPWLVLCPLICEDLARPDPVGDIVRAVGPNLLIALLMDGPQVKERWGARYATALADDPGCSVLTVTSLGMSTLSRPSRGGIDRRRVVALWKDSQNGSPTEIELPPGKDAVALSLSVRYVEEFTADGRSDDGAAGCPTLSGVYPLELAS